MYNYSISYIIFVVSASFFGAIFQTNIFLSLYKIQFFVTSLKSEHDE